jgi:hypothetical protein
MNYNTLIIMTLELLIILSGFVLLFVNLCNKKTFYAWRKRTAMGVVMKIIYLTERISEIYRLAIIHDIRYLYDAITGSDFYKDIDINDKRIPQTIIRSALIIYPRNILKLNFVQYFHIYSKIIVRILHNNGNYLRLIPEINDYLSENDKIELYLKHPRIFDVKNVDKTQFISAFISYFKSKYNTELPEQVAENYYTLKFEVKNIFDMDKKIINFIIDVLIKNINLMKFNRVIYDYKKLISTTDLDLDLQMKIVKKNIIYSYLINDLKAEPAIHIAKKNLVFYLQRKEKDTDQIKMIRERKYEIILASEKNAIFYLKCQKSRGNNILSSHILAGIARNYPKIFPSYMTVNDNIAFNHVLGGNRLIEGCVVSEKLFNKLMEYAVVNKIKLTFCPGTIDFEWCAKKIMASELIENAINIKGMKYLRSILFMKDKEKYAKYISYKDFEKSSIVYGHKLLLYVDVSVLEAANPLLLISQYGYSIFEYVIKRKIIPNNLRAMSTIKMVSENLIERILLLENK